MGLLEGGIMGFKAGQKIIDKIRGKGIKESKNKKWFIDCLNEFIKNDKNPRFSIKKEDFFPCLKDCTNDTSFEPHYTYHPAWALRILKKINPEKHIDISSSLTFCTTLSAFIPTEFYDYRPAQLTLSDLECKKADLCSLPFDDNSIKSLSCMHVIEHIGLGRYGDAIDPDGDLKAIKELKRVLALNGDLLFVVPIAQTPKICFNAHRIYSYDMIIEYFKDFKLINFALIKDNSEFIENAKSTDVISQGWGCGCFWFKKES